MNKDRYQSTSARRALALLNSPQVIPLLTVKNTLIPDKGFQNAEILYQAVIAQSVEPRQIFVSVSINERFKTGEGSNPTRLIFFHEGDILGISPFS